MGVVFSRTKSSVKAKASQSPASTWWGQITAE